MAHNQQRFLCAAFAFSASLAPRLRQTAPPLHLLRHTAPPPLLRRTALPPRQCGPFFGTFRPNTTTAHNAETPTVAAVPSFTVETLLQLDFPKAKAAAEFYKCAFGAVQISSTCGSPWPEPMNRRGYRLITSIKLKFGGNTVVVQDFVRVPPGTRTEARPTPEELRRLTETAEMETPTMRETRARLETQTQTQGEAWRLVTETEEDRDALIQKAVDFGAETKEVVSLVGQDSVPKTTAAIKDPFGFIWSISPRESN